MRLFQTSHEEGKNSKQIKKRRKKRRGRRGNILVNTKTRSQLNRNSPSPSHTFPNITNSCYLLKFRVGKLNVEKKQKEKYKTTYMFISVLIYSGRRGGSSWRASAHARVPSPGARPISAELGGLVDTDVVTALVPVRALIQISS